MSDDDLLRKAREAGDRTERLRQDMLTAAAERSEAIKALRARGWTVRALAAELGVSKAVIQGIGEKRR